MSARFTSVEPDERASLTRFAAACAFMLVACWCALRPASSAVDASAKEFELKAAYIYNFTKFTSWPAASFPDEQSPLVIGVLGNERVASALDGLANGRKVHGRALVVRTLSAARDIAGVHVLYVDSSVEGQLTQSPAALASPGTLTIGESDRFAALGGAIRFTVEGERLRFVINVSATQRAGLVLSSQLLSLAKSVSKSP